MTVISYNCPILTVPKTEQLLEGLGTSSRSGRQTNTVKSIQLFMLYHICSVSAYLAKHLFWHLYMTSFLKKINVCWYESGIVTFHTQNIDQNVFSRKKILSRRKQTTAKTHTHMSMEIKIHTNVKTNWTNLKNKCYRCGLRAPVRVGFVLIVYKYNIKWLRRFVLGVKNFVTNIISHISII